MILRVFVRIIFGEFVVIFFFHDSQLENISVLGGFLERHLPSRIVILCLPLCAARDLKSSQCAVHVVGPVHCTQRKGHVERK